MREKKKDDVVACVMAFIPRGWGVGVLRYRLGLEMIQMQILLQLPELMSFVLR